MRRRPVAAKNENRYDGFPILNHNNHGYVWCSKISKFSLFRLKSQLALVVSLTLLTIFFMSYGKVERVVLHHLVRPVPFVALHQLNSSDILKTSSITTICSTTVENRECRIHQCDEDGKNQNVTSVLPPYTFVNHSNLDIEISMRISGYANAGSGCAISRKYKFFYIHNLKSGGIAIKSFLKDALSPMNDHSRHHRLGLKIPRQRMDKRHFKNLDSGGEWIQIVNCREGLKEARKKSFFVFSFVRSPYKRLYSAYSMALHMKITGAEEFSFRDFVLDRKKIRRLSHMHPVHYKPQVLFLFGKDGTCPVFDFIGRLEMVDRDMNLLFDEIEKANDIGEESILRTYFNSKMNGTLFRKNDHGHKQNLQDSNSTCKIGGYPCGSMEAAFMDKEVVKHIRNEFKDDFYSFGYDVDDIPS